MSATIVARPAGHPGLVMDGCPGRLPPHCLMECPTDTWEDALQLPREDVQHALYEPFNRTTHSTILVHDDPVPRSNPDTTSVRVYNGNDGTCIPFKVKSMDTIAKLRSRYQKWRPELEGKLNLAFNGKPVPGEKTMKELGVKPGATFITFQKVTGG
ncbi:uncharacterized protein LOC143525832 [Brachyhypopomus gauderio]|uniref:uncharacterized protein LOC143525832 n=1 Tax=Brachyhypopomus gauderio TaxID=698409 RepID=UPI0040437A4F